MQGRKLVTCQSISMLIARQDRQWDSGSSLCSDKAIWTCGYYDHEDRADSTATSIEKIILVCLKMGYTSQMAVYPLVN
jgi:hypothetical protein